MTSFFEKKDADLSGRKNRPPRKGTPDRKGTPSGDRPAKGSGKGGDSNKVNGNGIHDTKSETKDEQGVDAPAAEETTVAAD